MAKICTLLIEHGAKPDVICPKWQQENPQEPPIGAIVVEWDFGDTAGEHNMQFMMHSYDGPHADKQFGFTASTKKVMSSKP